MNYQRRRWVKRNPLLIRSLTERHSLRTLQKHRQLAVGNLNVEYNSSRI
ncbi:hypothetical protein X975_13861, partial [Stegodyphus mimosarum]